jgi:glucose-6-phosphate 1-dehydrogenase
MPAFRRSIWSYIASRRSLRSSSLLQANPQLHDWSGPLKLRTGKRLASHVAEIVVNFKPVPHSALGADAYANANSSNRLTIRLQPKESIRLGALVKTPGLDMSLRNVYLDLAFDQFFSDTRMDAYERLLLDVIAGRLALFVRRDGQEAAWKWVAPIQELWQRSHDGPKLYLAGSWGSVAASALLARDGTCWPEESPAGAESPHDEAREIQVTPEVAPQ